MDWLTGSKQGETKKLIAQLADPVTRDRAAQSLIQLGGEAVPQLLDALQTQDVSLLPVYQKILTRIPSVVPALTNALSTAHPFVRGRVVEILAIIKDKSTIPALLDALKGEYFTVRSRSALALAEMGDAGVIPHLLPLLKDTEDEVRIAACVALGKFRAPSTFDDITNILLDDPKIEVRQSAARSLGETRHPAAIPFLMEALRDSFWWYEREQSANDLLAAIEKMGAAVVDPLIEALSDKEGTVRRFAALLLGRLGDARAIEPLGMTLYDLHDEIARTAAGSLANFGAAAVDVLLESLNHAETGIRENAVFALGRIQDTRVFPALIESLRDSQRSVQAQAIKSLGELRDPRGITSLQEIAANRADRELSALAKQVLESIK